MAKPRRDANGSRRRAARARVLATETHCAWCHEWVDQSLPMGHLMAPEVDEIVPFSRGGSSYARDNLQLMHRLCNQAKSNSMPGDLGPRLPASRAW